MKKTLFVVSDEHGHYKELREALSNAGWDEKNPNHLLISCGDCFDRGSESLSIYKFYKKLTEQGRAVVLKGNHTTMFIDFLEWSNSPFNYIHNGLNETIADFVGRTAPFESWCAIDKDCDMNTLTYAEWAECTRKDINNEYPELLEWLKNLPWYYETKNYIFVHGGIDTKAKDWRYPKVEYFGRTDWDALSWDDGSFLGKKVTNTNKTIVCGHFSTKALRERYTIADNPDDLDDILYYDNKIFLDTCTILTKRINVLKIEEEELMNE